MKMMLYKLVTVVYTWLYGAAGHFLFSNSAL